MIPGIYTLWSTPRGPRPLSPLELVTLALSALSWRRHQGPTHLYCDARARDELAGHGLSELFDAIHDLDEDALADINGSVFWSAARHQAISNVELPFAALDLDLVVWRPLGPLPQTGTTIVAHWESTDPSPWYPPPDELTLPPTYRIQSSDVWPLPAANVALVYFADRQVRDAYVHEALQVMRSNPAPKDEAAGVAPELLFADQRLLSVVAARHGAPLHAFVDALWSPAHDRFVDDDPRGPWDPIGIERSRIPITHLWFYKATLPPSHPRLTALASALWAELHAQRPDLAARLPIITLDALTDDQ